MPNQSNTPGVGGEFEVLVPAYFALVLNKNERIRDFSIGSNVSKEFGNLDDVVVDIVMDDGKRYGFAFQLKVHKRNLSPDSLQAEEGKFSLEKYCKTFKQIGGKYPNFRFILYTDARFHISNTSKVQRFDMNHHTVETVAVLREHEESKNFEKMYQNCYFMFYTEEAGGIVKDVTQEYQRFVSLDRTYQICYFMFYTDVNTATHSHDLFHLMQDFNTSDDKVNVYTFVMKNPNDVKKKANGQNRQTKDRNKPVSVNEEDFKRFFSKVYLYTCQKDFERLQDDIETILGDENAALRYVELFRDWHQGRFTNKVIDKKTLNSHLVDIFLNLSLVKNHRLLIVENEKMELLHRIVKAFDVTVIQDSIDVFKSDFFKGKMIECWNGFDPLRIKDKLIHYMTTYKMDLDKLESQPKEAAERCLVRMAQEYKFIKKTKQTVDDEMQLKMLHYCFETPLIVEFDKDSGRGVYSLMKLYKMTEERIKFVLVGRGIESEEFSHINVFENLNDLEQKKKLLFDEAAQLCEVSLQGRSANKLQYFIDNLSVNKEWVETKEIFRMLEDGYRAGSEVTEELPFEIGNVEWKIFENQSAIRLIPAKTGMGKSTTVQHLKNVCPSSLWIAGHAFEYYKSVSDDLASLEKALESTGANRNLESFLKEQKNVAIFFDELDAVSVSNLNEVFEYVKDLFSRGYTVFLSSRKHLQVKIQENFPDEVEVVDIERSRPKKETEDYIAQNVFKGQSGENLELVKDVLVIDESTGYLNIPLFLSSEELAQELLQKKTFDSVTLCSIYFAVLCRHFSEKMRRKGAVHRMILESDVIMQSKREFAALEFLFDGEILSKLGIDTRVYKDFLSEVEEYNDPLGVVSLRDDGRIEFEHRSLAEYLAGNYFAYNRDKYGVLIKFRPIDDKVILKETYEKGITSRRNRSRKTVFSFI